jgi:hypothetical protein
MATTVNISTESTLILAVAALGFIFLVIKCCCTIGKAKSADQEQISNASHINQNNRPWSLSTSSTNQTLSSPAWAANQTSTPPWQANQPWSVTLSSANQMPSPRSDDMPPSYDASYMPPSYDSIEIQNKY